MALTVSHSVTKIRNIACKTLFVLKNSIQLTFQRFDFVF